MTTTTRTRSADVAVATAPIHDQFLRSLARDCTPYTRDPYSNPIANRHALHKAVYSNGDGGGGGVKSRPENITYAYERTLRALMHEALTEQMPMHWARESAVSELMDFIRYPDKCNREFSQRSR